MKSLAVCFAINMILFSSSFGGELDFREIANSGKSSFTLAFSPDLQTVAVGGESVELWDMKTNMVISRLSATRHVFSMSFSPDSRNLISASGDVPSSRLGVKKTTNATIEHWDLQRRVRTSQWHVEADVAAVAYSPKGKWFVVAEGRKRVHVHDSGTLKELFSLPKCGGPIAFMSEDRLACANDNGDRIVFWNLANREKISDHPAATDFAHSRIKTLAVSSDGKLTATAFAQDVVVFSNDNCKIVGSLREQRGHDFTSISFLPGSGRLICGGENQFIKVWDVSRTKTDHKLGIAELYTRDVAIAPDGKLLGTLSGIIIGGSEETDLATSVFLWNIPPQ